MTFYRMKRWTLLVVLFFVWGTGEGFSQVVVNEVMANVKGIDGGPGTPGDRNEFVELFNFSAGTVDVDGWFLDDGDARDVLRAWTDTTINDPDVIINTTLIPTGAYAVILDPEYPDSGDGNYVQPYDFPPNTIILTVGNTTLGDGLSTLDPISLFDRDTLLIDTYGTPFDTTDTIPLNPGDGISMERIDPALPDLESNWLPSIDPTGSTPGRENSVSVGIEEGEENIEYRTLNVEFRLIQNQPNPFSTTTLIRYTLPAVSSQQSAFSDPLRVKLSIYDISGRLIETLVDKSQESGVFRVYWNGLDESGQKVSSGIYFYRLQFGDFISTKKTILLH